MESSTFYDLVKDGTLLFGNNVTVVDPYSFVSPSAYDTAWLAMVPEDSEKPVRPMFKECLNWILNNQKEEGCWGDLHGLETLPSTIACIIALNKWNIGKDKLDKGLSFVEEKSEEILLSPLHYESYPRWFVIVFPSMVELLHSFGVQIAFSDTSKLILMNLSYQRQQILQREKVFDENHYLPLASYLEALPESYIVDHGDIIKHLNNDGSLYQSPSATAQAFMATGSHECLAYLQSIVQRCSQGVPQCFPLDEELIKLCVVNQVEEFGLAEHFRQEIDEFLAVVFRNYKNKETFSQVKAMNVFPSQLHKDSLTFRILRLSGYNVSPWNFCWFLNNEKIKEHIENSPEYFSSVMLNVYKATELMFPGEIEVEEARSFSRNSLDKVLSMDQSTIQNCKHAFPSLRNVIEHEVNVPWITQMSHLENRMCIEEENNSNTLWMGKFSFHMLASPYKDNLRQLAIENFGSRQSTYKHELEELKRWTRMNGLSYLGFGREKTTYCYFAVASCTCDSFEASIRMMVSKLAILITVADDFYDTEGSIYELRTLTNAIRRWDGKDLNGHNKTIFNAWDRFMREVTTKHRQQHGNDVASYIRAIWYETFVSWFKEAKWSRRGLTPSIDEYIETGIVSIATHTIVLPCLCFLNKSFPKDKFKIGQYETITKLLMLISRLLNDTQSYQREQEEGKINFVLLYLKENPKANIEDAIFYTRSIIESKTREFLKHALMDGYNDLPRESKQLHLSCLKVFHMFFNSSNRYDSNTALLHDIQKAIYIPLQVQTSDQLKPLNPRRLLPQKKNMEYGIFRSPLSLKQLPKTNNKIVLQKHHTSLPLLRGGNRKILLVPKMNLGIV